MYFFKSLMRLRRWSGRELGTGGGVGARALTASSCSAQRVCLLFFGKPVGVGAQVALSWGGHKASGSE